MTELETKILEAAKRREVYASMEAGLHGTKGVTMKVRKGGVYVFEANGLDRFDRKSNTPANGTTVRVCTPYGCPPPNAMGHCFVETMDGKFIGLVSTGSLNKKSN